MHHASLSAADVKHIIMTTPRLVRLTSEKIENVCHKLYSSGLFVKLDIKKLIIQHPAILETSLVNVAENILNLSRIFELSDKKKYMLFLERVSKGN